MYTQPIRVFRFIKFSLLSVLLFSSVSFSQQPGKITRGTSTNGNNGNGAPTARPSTNNPPTPIVTPKPSTKTKTNPVVSNEKSDLEVLKELKNAAANLLFHIRKVQYQVELIDQSCVYAGLAKPADAENPALFTMEPKVKPTYVDPNKNIEVTGVDPTNRYIYDLGGMAQAIYAMASATSAGDYYIFSRDTKLPSSWKDLKDIAPFSGIPTKLREMGHQHEKLKKMVDSYKAGIDTALTTVEIYKYVPRVNIHANMVPMAGLLEDVKQLIDGMKIRFGNGE